MSAAKHIVIIGAGNLATQLGLTLHKEGYLISQVLSKTKKSAQTLAKKINSTAITDFKHLDQNASIYIFAVKDDIIADLAKKIKLKDQIVVHTSGTAPLAILKNCSKNIGVFYPLQTFSKEVVADFKTIPICVEGNNSSTTTTLNYFAKSISNNVHTINSEQRKIIHLSAVFASNFSNHMYAIAEELIKNSKLPFDLIKPLILETANKIQKGSAIKMQTGPAVRGDKQTMAEQMKMLSKNKKAYDIYKLLSDSIINTSKKNK